MTPFFAFFRLYETSYFPSLFGSTRNFTEGELAFLVVVGALALCRLGLCVIDRGYTR